MILIGANAKLTLTTEQWANVIIVAEDAGWKPQQLRMVYLVSGTVVSAGDALAFSAALRRLLDTALKNPFAVYPIRVGMEFVSLCADLGEEGEFRISE